jgi:hypothetical protein
MVASAAVSVASAVAAVVTELSVPSAVPSHGAAAPEATSYPRSVEVEAPVAFLLAAVTVTVQVAATVEEAKAAPALLVLVKIETVYVPAAVGLTNFRLNFVPTERLPVP